MWASFGFRSKRKISKNGVEHKVEKITNIGSIGPKSPSISPSTKPNTTKTNIWTKKNKINTDVSMEKIVFHGEDFCDR